MAEEQASVTEDITVQKAEEGVAPEAPSVEPQPPADEEVQPGEEAAAEFQPSPLALSNPFLEAERRLGRAVRSVTVHFHEVGQYLTLHAVAAEGPDTHIEHNLGRL